MIQNFFYQKASPSVIAGKLYRGIVVIFAAHESIWTLTRGTPEEGRDLEDVGEMVSTGVTISYWTTDCEAKIKLDLFLRNYEG
jgi:hypothetical protein